jgi:hypothetical protein
MNRIYKDSSSFSHIETIPELDKFPQNHWPYHYESDHSVDYYISQEYCVLLVQSVRPGKHQNEFVAAFVTVDDARFFARVYNTLAKNEFYENLQLSRRDGA